MFKRKPIIQFAKNIIGLCFIHKGFANEDHRYRQLSVECAKERGI